jgi:hypothetical protein
MISENVYNDWIIQVRTLLVIKTRQLLSERESQSAMIICRVCARRFFLKLAMHYGYKLHVVTFGTKRRRSLGNVCKHRSMERSGVKCFHCTHVFDLTISDDYLPSMRKAVLSISGNVYKQQEMEIDKLINDV